MNVAVELPGRLVWELSAVAERKGVKVADLIEFAVKNVGKPRESHQPDAESDEPPTPRPVPVMDRPAGMWAADVDRLAMHSDLTVEVAAVTYPRIPRAVLEHIFEERERRTAARKAI